MLCPTYRSFGCIDASCEIREESDRDHLCKAKTSNKECFRTGRRIYSLSQFCHSLTRSPLTLSHTHTHIHTRHIPLHPYSKGRSQSKGKPIGLVERKTKTKSVQEMMMEEALLGGQGGATDTKSATEERADVEDVHAVQSSSSSVSAYPESESID